MAGSAFQQQPQDDSIANSIAMRQAGATVSPKDVGTALKPYGLTAKSVKGKTDTQLRQMADTSVVQWWKKQHPAKPAVAAAQQKVPTIHAGDVTPQQAMSVLKAQGVPGWIPPSYVLHSQADLLAWINRAKRNRGY